MFLEKDYILGLVEDKVADFMYYDCKNNEDCPVGSIEATIEAGIVTVDELVAQFRKTIEENL